MIRWYDRAVALIIAFLIASNAIMVLVSIWYFQLIGALGIWLLMDTWNSYCKFRLTMEENK